MRNSVLKYLSLSSRDRHFKIKANKYGHKQFKIKYPNSSKPTRSLTIELSDLNLILATPTIINDSQYLPLCTNPLFPLYTQLCHEKSTCKDWPMTSLIKTRKSKDKAVHSLSTALCFCYILLYLLYYINR